MASPGGLDDDNAAFERLEDEFERATGGAEEHDPHQGVPHAPADHLDGGYEDFDGAAGSPGPGDDLGDMDGMPLGMGPDDDPDDLLLSERYQGYVDYYDAIPIGDRLYMKGQQTLRRKHENVLKAQHIAHENEVKGQQKKPQITRVGQEVTRSNGDPDKFVSLQMEWLRKRNRRVDQKKEMIESEKAEDIVKVKATAMSNRILAGRHQGPIEAWDERERHFRAAHNVAQKTAPATFHPIISPAAQTLKRSGPVGDRLYKRATEKAKAPPPKKASGKRITDEGFETLLKHMKVHKDAAVRKFQNKKKNLESEEGPYRPEVCGRSLKILDRQGGHIPIHLRSSRMSATPRPETEERPPARRKEPNPEEITPFGLVSKIPQQKLKVQRRLEDLRGEREADLKEHCTFKPKTCKRSLKMASRREGSIRYHQGQSPTSTHHVDPADSLEGEDECYYGGEGAFVPGGYDPTYEGHYVGGLQEPGPGQHASAHRHHHGDAGGSGGPFTPRGHGGRHHTASPRDSHHDAYAPEGGVDVDAHGDMDPHGDGHVAQWEVDWMNQQRDIERILHQYTSTTQRNMTFTGPPGGGAVPTPEASPATPRTHHTMASSAPRGPGGAVPAGASGIHPSHLNYSHDSTLPAPHGGSMSPPPAPVATAAATATPETLAHNAVSDLQTVLDGWRQLEDQFSHSFEKLRLR